MQKIVPHLWFDKEAKEAAEFYVGAFGGDSRIVSHVILPGTPSGDAETVSFSLSGCEFMAISAGPYFSMNPSISFMVNFDPSRDAEAETHLDALWEKLSEGGKAFMPLDAYPFAKRYGWAEDRFGVSWQLILTDPDGEERPFIIPALMYVTDPGVAAEEAMRFYLSVFKDARQGQLARYPAGMEPNKEGAVMFSDFMLEGQWFVATDASASEHRFAFNEAVSFMVRCKSQEEIDHYWNALSAVPEAEQCGWLKDRFGVSWQVVPKRLAELMTDPDKAKVARVTEAFMQMRKFDIALLEAAYRGD